jgi:hypothetical protein
LSLSPFCPPQYAVGFVRGIFVATLAENGILSYLRE